MTVRQRPVEVFPDKRLEDLVATTVTAIGT